jgi:glycosyltransferase involved in cell wall biosynthesis
MRILHVALTRGNEAAGWLSVALARALQGQGHFNWLVGLAGSPLLDDARHQGLPVLSETVPHCVPWDTPQASAQILHAIERQRPHVVILHTDLGHLECHQACAGSVPLVRMLWQSPSRDIDLPLRWLYREAADRLGVPGRYVLRHLEGIGIGEGDAVVLPPAIDLGVMAWRSVAGRAQMRRDVRDRHRISVNVPLIGVLGEISPDSGHSTLIEAAGQLAAAGRDFRLSLACVRTSRELGQLGEQVQRLGIADRLVFAEQAGDPLCHAAALDIGVLPHTGPEPDCRCALECMAAGVPVVASLAGILPEMIDEDELLVPPGRPDRLAAALGRLLDDLPWAGRLGERAFQRVQAEHSLAALGVRAEAFLSEVLALRSGVVVTESGVA